MSTDIAPWKEAFGGLVSPGDVIDSTYRVDRVLRGGGVGVVVQAQHLRLDERVAIKFLRPKMSDNAEAVARFEREARSAFKLHSEHIARVIDVGRLDDKLPYIVMEYLEGEDLADVLAERNNVPVSEAAEYGLQLCAALHAAHTLGIIHRDIKPENLFITPRADGTSCLQVLDFGLSKALDVSTANTNGRRQRELTKTGHALGTPQYMAPEQWLSASEADARADIWAAGVIVYELVAGVPPYQAKQPAALCRMILQDEAPPLSNHQPGVPPAFEAAVMRCLRKKPNDRYASIDDFSKALRPFATSTLASPAGMRAPLDSQAAAADSSVRTSAVPAAAAQQHIAQAESEDKGTLRMDRQRSDELRERLSDLPDNPTVLSHPSPEELNKHRAALISSAPNDVGAINKTQPWLEAGSLPEIQDFEAEPAQDGSKLAWVVAALLVLAALVAAILFVRRLESSPSPAAETTAAAPTAGPHEDGVAAEQSAAAVTATPSASSAASTTATGTASASASAPVPAPQRPYKPQLPQDIFNKR